MFPTLPEDLSTLSDAELSQLHDEFVTAFNEAADDESTDLEVLSQAADDIDTIRTEQATREEAASERDNAVSALRNRVNASDEDGDDEGGEDDGDGDTDAEGEGDGDAESEGEGEGEGSSEGEGSEDGGEGSSEGGTEGEGEGSSGSGSEGGASVTASAKKRKKGSLSTLRKGAPARTRPRSENAVSAFNLTAAADVSGFAAGQKLTSTRQLAEALISRNRTMGRGNGDNVPVGTFHLDMPADRQLNEHMSTTEVLDRIQSFDANGASIVAAGGLCAPTQGYYDQMVIAQSDRPVRDALANFQATRGGIKFNPPPTLANITGGYGIVTAAQDASGTTKSCLTVTCAAAQEVVVSAIYSCLTFGNMGAITFPEQVEAYTKLMLAQYARTAETMLLDAIASLSTPVTMAGLVGAGREILARFGQAAAAYRSRNRMSPQAQLRAMLPAWALELIRTDLARTLGTSIDEALSVADATIARWFAVRNINVSWYLDSKTGGGQIFGAAAPVQTFADGATTSGSANFTSASAAFTSADVGRTVVATGVPNGTTIASVTNGTTVVLSANATATATGLSFTINRLVAHQYPTMLYSYLFAEGTFLHLDAGTLDIGLVRDSTLNSNNQFQLFNEGFENVAKLGPDAVELRLAVQPDGSYSAAKTVNTPIAS